MRMCGQGQFRGPEAGAGTTGPLVRAEAGIRSSDRSTGTGKQCPESGFLGTSTLWKSNKPVTAAAPIHLRGACERVARPDEEPRCNAQPRKHHYRESCESRLRQVTVLGERFSGHMGRESIYARTCADRVTAHQPSAAIHSHRAVSA